MVPGVLRPLAETSSAARSRVIESTRRGMPLDERPEDELERALVAKGYSPAEVARIVAVVAQCLAGRRHYWPVQRSPAQAVRKAEVAAAKRSGLSWSEIAARFNVSRSTAQRAYRAWLAEEVANAAHSTSTLPEPGSAAPAVGAGECPCSRFA